MGISAELVARLRGKFVVLDGPDGSGKSTQCRRLAEGLRGAGEADLVTARDPGGTEIGDRIRSVLLDFDLSRMDVNCEALLFMASRAQLVAEIIRPALLHGKTVLCDRFVSSTCAYQGAAGLDPARIVQLAEFAIARTWPDLTIIIEVDAETGMRRIEQKRLAGSLPNPSVNAGGQRALGSGTPPNPAMTKVTAPNQGVPGGFAPAGPPQAGDAAVGGGPSRVPGAALAKDAMERRPIEFHRRVCAAFRELRAYYPSPVALVNGDATEDAVFERMVAALTSTFVTVH